MRLFDINKMSLGQKMTVSVFAVSVSALALLSIIIAVRITDIQTETSYQSARNLADVYTAAVRDDLENAMISARVLAQAMSTPERIPVAARRDYYRNLVQSVAGANKDFFGIWTIWEPNALDGLDSSLANTPGYDFTGRFIIYCYWDNGRLITEQTPSTTYLESGVGDYYQLPVKRGKETILEPYVDTATGKPIVMTTVAVPIIQNGKVLGIVGVDITLEKLQEMVSGIKPYGSGVAALFSNDGIVTAHFDPSRLGRQMRESERDMSGPNTDAFADAVKNGEQIEFTVYAAQMKTDLHIIGTPFIVGKTGTSWTFTVGIPMNMVLAPVRELTRYIIWISIGVSALILLAVILLARSITKPIVLMVAKTREIASGELNVTIPEQLLIRGDELGSMAIALQDMRERLRQVISEVIGSVGQVSDGSSQLSGTAQQLSQGATEQASAVEEISSSMEEMASNIRQNADSAMQTEKIARSSALAAEEGGKAVSATVLAMKEIASKISIIEEIARSTNMLSLNASIEAARAGEFGKGFAVVASEVGKLAERSQREAGEISKLSAESLITAERAGKTISALIPEIQRTAELIQEISAASNEQNAGAGQINSSIIELDKVVQQNAAASEETAAMAEQLSSQARVMQGTVSFFKTDEKELN